MGPEDASTSRSAPSYMDGLRKGLKKYGRTGVAVYLGISFSVTAGDLGADLAWPVLWHALEGHTVSRHVCADCTGFYVAIERNVDVKKLLGMTGG
jgi:hypothetical protein